MQRAHGAQGRFQRQGLRGVQAGHAFHPVGLAARGQCVQRREFTVLCGHDELAALVVGDVVAIEEFVEQVPAFDAEACLQRAWRVVQTGVDHLELREEMPAPTRRSRSSTATLRPWRASA